MLFNSFNFLIFFPTLTLLYFAFPHKLRMPLIFIASSFFYMAAIPRYIFIIYGLILLDFAAALVIHNADGTKRKLYLLLSLLGNLAVLSYFKYFNFITEIINEFSRIIGANERLQAHNLLLPIGLSFHTFQSMSYVIDVYQKKFSPEKNLLKYACFVLFFPQLVAGPIERARHLLPQFDIPHKFNPENLKAGLRLILFGLYKKVVIADGLGLFVDQVFKTPSSFDSLSVFASACFFSIQLYCDFAGYSDIARGSAKILGFDLVVNFNQPLEKGSFRKIWQNWNISLFDWLRDYIYVPLNERIGSRSFALILTFLISGLWHGAGWTFVIWGALNGILLLFSEFIAGKIDLNGRLKHVNQAAVFVAFSFTMIFFRSASVEESLFVSKKFVFAITELSTAFSLFLSNTNLWLALAVVAALKIVEHFERNESYLLNVVPSMKLVNWSANYAAYLFLAAALLFSIVKTGVQARPFIYFQF